MIIITFYQQIDDADKRKLILLKLHTLLNHKTWDSWIIPHKYPLHTQPLEIEANNQSKIIYDSAVEFLIIRKYFCHFLEIVSKVMHSSMD